MDRPPPPRRGRPPPGPPPSRGRRRGAGRGGALIPPSRSGPLPPPPASRQPRPKNRRRRGVPGPPPPIVHVKLVVRRLPPTLTEEAFAEAADPLGASLAVWRSFAPGSASASGPVKRVRTVVRHAVAYLGFSTMADAIKFSDAFNGFRFEEPAAASSHSPAEYFARVERAMWQNVPPLGKRRNPNPLQGTIESDQDYLQFVKELEAEGRRESNRNGSLSAVQSLSVNSPNGAAASSSQSIGDVGIIGGVLDKGSKGKGGTPVSSRNNVVTPLMEDVRARRKERDLKKKGGKAPPRAPRMKGRQIVVTDPSRSSGDMAKPVIPRKKKQAQRRSGDFSGGGNKSEEQMVVTKKIGAKGPMNGRRGMSVSARDDGDARISNGSISSSVRSNSSQSGSVQSEANGYNGNGKGIAGRGGGPSRGRTGRATRGKGKGVGGAVGNAGNAGNATYVRDGQWNGSDGSHSSVRLLKKEASAGHKT